MSSVPQIETPPAVERVRDFVPNREQAEAHIWMLTGATDTVMDWRIIPPSRLKGSLRAQNIRGTLADVWDRLVAANRDGFGIFFMIQPTDGCGFRAGNVVGFRAAYVEFDDGSPWEPIRARLDAAGVPPTFAVQSKNGPHFYFRMAPGEDVTDTEDLLKGMAAALGSDPHVCDRARVLRVAGFAHTKAEDPYAVSVAYADPLQPTYSVRRIVEALAIPVPGPTPTSSAANTIALAGAGAPSAQPGPFAGINLGPILSDAERIERAMRYLAKVPPAIQGKGGDAATLAACMVVVVDFDLDDEGAEEALEDWNSRCVPPWEPTALAEKIRNARLYGAGPFGSKARRPSAEPSPEPSNGSSPNADELVTSTAADVYRWLQRHTKILLGTEYPIRLNTRTDEIEIGPRDSAIVLMLDEAIARFQRRLGDVQDATYVAKNGFRTVRKIPDGIVVAQLLSIAREYAFDPVREHFDDLPRWDGIDRIPQLLGCLNVVAPSPLFLTYLRKTLIGAVARVYQPGCKLDTCLVLIESLAGRKKSTFFRALVGAEFFSDAKIDVESRDSLMLVRRYFGIEFSEMGTLSSARSREAVKSFMSRQEDSYRAPYGRAIQMFPRSCFFVGTANDEAILENDEGLRRRFWIIGGVQRIDVASVATIRDQIWAQAIAAYRAHEEWWLTESDEALHHEIQERHVMPEDAGLERLAGFLSTFDDVSVDQILTSGPDYFKTSQFYGRRGQMAVAKMLKALGWEKVRLTRHGVQRWIWQRTSAAEMKSGRPTKLGAVLTFVPAAKEDRHG